MLCLNKIISGLLKLESGQKPIPLFFDNAGITAQVYIAFRFLIFLATNMIDIALFKYNKLKFNLNSKVVQYTILMQFCLELEPCLFCRCWNPQNLKKC